MGPHAVIVPAHHDAATTGDAFLGYGGLAHGMERQRCRDER